MTALLLSVLSPLLLGYCLLRLVAPRTSLTFRISLGAGLGAGLVSCFFFVGLITGLPTLALEAVALVVTAVLCIGQRPAPPAPRAPWTLAAKLLGGVFTLSSAAGLLAFVSVLNNQRHGGWDAWVVWNTRAHFLASPAWRDGFSPILFYTRADYPLLLPGFIARTWKVTGGGELAAPALIAALFTFATVGVLVGSLSVLRGRAQGFIAGILLLSTHFFIVQGACEYADVPMSFFLLSTCATFALANHTKNQPWLPILSGLSAGLAAWTKNEGWMLISAIAILSLLALLRPRTRRTQGGHIILAAAGITPVLAIVLYFKYAFATTNTFVGGRSLHSLTVLLSNPARYRALGHGLLNAAVGPANHNFFVPAIGMLVFAFCARPDSNRDRVTTLVCACTLAIVFTGYCATLIISPYEIGWQVATALDRLLLQLLPAALFTAFLTLRTVD